MTLDSSTTPSTGTTPGTMTGSTTGTFPGTTSGPTTGQSSGTASTAAAQGQHVAGTAKDEALNVAGTAAEQAKNVVSDAKQQMAAQMSDQATTQRDKLSQTLRTLGDDLQHLVEQGPTEGMASDLAREVSDRVKALGSHLEDREPGQLLDDARDFARRRPGTFLLGALAAGVVAGRLFRATADGAAASELAETPSPVVTRPTPTPTTTSTFAGVGTPATTGPPRADYAAPSPTLADPERSLDDAPTTTGFPGDRTLGTP